MLEDRTSKDDPYLRLWYWICNHGMRAAAVLAVLGAALLIGWNFRIG